MGNANRLFDLCMQSIDPMFKKVPEDKRIVVIFFHLSLTNFNMNT